MQFGISKLGFLLLITCLAPSLALYSSSSPVFQLNPSNFKSKVLNSNGVVLVEFFAPWCGHCKALTPIWERAATVLKGIATVAALDADAHKSLAQVQEDQIIAFRTPISSRWKALSLCPKFDGRPKFDGKSFQSRPQLPQYQDEEVEVKKLEAKKERACHDRLYHQHHHRPQLPQCYDDSWGSVETLV